MSKNVDISLHRVKDIQRHAEHYARVFFYLGTPDGAVNNCRRASADYRDNIAEKGYLLHCSGPLKKFPLMHLWHQRWVKAKKDPTAIDHVVWCWRGVTVDFTYRQFDPLSTYPRILPLKQLKTEWEKVERIKK